MLDILWSGWRAQYISSLPESQAPKDGRSVFRRILESGLGDEESFIIHRGEHVFAIMNSYPYAVGHFMVVPYRQVAALEELSPVESAELWRTVTEGVRVAKEALGPEGLNVGLNIGTAAGGSVNEHLHVHVVPRWTGDNNFLVATARTKSISQPLDVTADALRRVWRDLEPANRVSP